MKKKFGIYIICLMFVFTSCTIWAEAESKTASVDIPTYSITLNGQKINNHSCQYPFITYLNITYLPLTYDNMDFLGIKIKWYRDLADQKLLFIGRKDRTFTQLPSYTSKTANANQSSAIIPSFLVLLNSNDMSNEMANQQLPYPILNFRNVLYVPITWDFIVNGMGWNYSFDSGKGLQIDSTDPRKPFLDDAILGMRDPVSMLNSLTSYVYGDGNIYYVGYPNSTEGNRYQLIVKKAGEPESTINLKDSLSDGVFYKFNETWNADGSNNTNPDIKPSITGNIFTISCARLTETGIGSNFLLKIDLDKGKVISKELLS